MSRKRLDRELTPLQDSMRPLVVRGRDFVVETGAKRDRHADFVLPALLKIRKRQPGIQALVITQKPEDIRKTGQLFEDALRTRAVRHTRGRVEVVRLGCDASVRKEAAWLERNPDIVVAGTERVIDHIRRDNIDLRRVRICVVDEPDAETANGFNADLEYIFTKFSRNPQTVVFVRDKHDGVADVVSLLRRPTTISQQAWRDNGSEQSTTEEGTAVSIKSFDELRKDEELQKRIKDIVKQIHDEEDPDELNAYKKIIKRNVPVFARAYFAAYLLKQAHQNEGGLGKSKKTSGSANGYQSIFVSVGKNRKVFPRDLVQLFTNVNDIGSNDIGQIKILDNYSFVEVTQHKAVSAIEELNGTEFRGRKITVNYARKKDNS